MTRVNCSECSQAFVREPNQEWRKRCVKCWLASKGERMSAEAELRAEIGANLKPLIGLCHPDRHGNSEQANRTTAWLLSLRARLNA